MCAAAAKLTNLTIAATRAPCVVHRRGRLHIERCQLLCEPQGLPHLVAPLVTVASSLPPSRASSPAPGATPNISAAAPSLPLRGAAGAVGAGRLTVAECRFLGGSAAVQCCGTGGLDAVRVVYEAHAAFFFLEVDSSWPGTLGHHTGGAKLAYLGEAPERLPAARLPPLAPRKPGAPLLAPLVVHARPPVVVKAERSCSGGGAVAGGGGSSGAPGIRLSPEGVSAAAGGAPSEQERVQGLQRIEQLLGKRAISPAMLLEHLQARSRQRRQ